MTKKEHMVELTEEDFEGVEFEQIKQLVKHLEKQGISIGSAIENYIDAVKYEWLEYLHHPDVIRMFQFRCFLIEQINQLDAKIDEHIEEHMTDKK